MPDLRVLEERTDSRSTVIRRAILLVPSAAILLSLLATAVANQSVLAAIVLVLGGGAATVEAVAALRDLRATPVTTEGTVRRVWKKARFLFLGRVDYALVDHHLFEVRADTAFDLREGDQVVIEHWPHTNTVISVALPPRDTPPPRRQ